MKIKTAELIGAALDWAVAKCEGAEYLSRTSYDGIGNEYPPTHYSTDWAQAGPIIERERIELHEFSGAWSARFSTMRLKPDGSARSYLSFASAASPLIAAMRCYVASKLGDEVEVPEGLV